MNIYLASPNTQQQAEHAGASGMPVLLSYASWDPWLKGYQQCFERVLIDSGAYSELNSGRKIDLAAYSAWAEQWRGRAEAIAGLDDISGDWQRSLRNYRALPPGFGFPTYHDTDPPELVPELVSIACERGGWIGIGLKPPRAGKAAWVETAIRDIRAAPGGDSLHIHGWALGLYDDHPIDSYDSTTWWRQAMQLRTHSLLSHLNYGECLDIAIKRMARRPRRLRVATQGALQLEVT